jgi:(1->4)-alpha-D-glucan 1-alpha-D-glucosylmutase
MIPPDLARACERYGVAVRYRDFWHREYDAPEATLRKVLAAMGVDPATPLRHEAPPLVLRASATPRAIDLAIAAPAQTLNLRWRLDLESGGRLEGACEPADTTDASHVAIRCGGLPPDLPTGYHRLVITDTAPGGMAVASVAAIVCPSRCHLPPPVRMFGPSVQLYALRSRRNWGIGDFTDLSHLAAIAAREGADFVGVNPLHALFLVRPDDASPYSPSSRLAVNPLYLDVEALDDFATCEAARATVASAPFQADLAALRGVPLVDYPAVAARKLRVLAQVFDHFSREHLERTTDRGLALRAFGEAHRDLAFTPALFEALHAALHAGDPAAWGWPAWPERYRDHEGAAVQAFAHAHRREVDFFLYLQWQADRQLAAAQAAATGAGMRIGLYRDLAVGANPGGAETWQAPERFAIGVHVGAPPDEFNRGGQDWGLPPWIPHRLPAGAYAPWVALLRANMRHAGALRIDHVMALLRLFWIPEGAKPPAGTYVAYPLDDLLALLALESARHACAVIGEDLGTVPDEVRAALRDAGVHSYRVLWFERGAGGAFARPKDYPAQALCSVTTHDLPTLAGFWSGADLAARDALALFPDATVREAQYAERAADRPRLVRALADEGLAAAADPLPDALDATLVRAVHAYLARTPSALMAVQLEDVFGETEQVNLPATSEGQRPNWRRKVPVALEDWADDGRFAAVCAAIRAEGRGVP